MGVSRSPWPGLIDAYLARRCQAGIRSSTLATQANELETFVAFTKAHTLARPADLTRAHLEGYLDYLMEEYRIRGGPREGRRLSSVGVYDRFRMALAFIGFLVDSDHLVIDPRLDVVSPRCRKRRRSWIPAADDVAHFLATIPLKPLAPLRDRALFELLYATGLRAGEAGRLDVYDLDFTASTVRVRQGKGGYDRVVPLGRIAADVLKRYLCDVWPEWSRALGQEALFLTKYGTRLTPVVIASQCRYWRRRARLPRLTAHLLRHAAATHMLAAGANIRYVQEFLGHVWINTTERYTHLVIDDLARVHARTHPRGGPRP